MREAAQIHARQITTVSATSLGQWAPRATRARQPSTTMAEPTTSTPMASGVLRTRAATTASKPNVTEKNVMVVEGKVKPDGEPITAISSREGRGRPNQALVCSAPPRKDFS